MCESIIYFQSSGAESKCARKIAACRRRRSQAFAPVFTSPRASRVSSLRRLVTTLMMSECVSCVVRVGEGRNDGYRMDLRSGRVFWA